MFLFPDFQENVQTAWKICGIWIIATCFPNILISIIKNKVEDQLDSMKQNFENMKLIQNLKIAEFSC